MTDLLSKHAANERLSCSLQSFENHNSENSKWEALASPTSTGG